ncbi:MAG: ABC transporter ATP-binding protein [Propionibacteriaceae bacterium]
MSDTGSAAVITERVEKRYGDRVVLSNVSFQVPEGQVFGLLGPNGSGKTTTMRIISGNLQRDQGSVLVLGSDPGILGRHIRSYIGIVPQEDGLDPELTVAQNLTVFGRYFGLHGRQLKLRVQELLEECGLSMRAPDRIDTLSGGMRRRLVLARAMLSHPKILLMDEPTTALDPGARHEVWESIRTLTRETGVSVLLTTHFMDEAEYLCDSVSFINYGSTGPTSSPQEFIKACCPRDIVEVKANSQTLARIIADLPDRIPEYSQFSDRLCFRTDSGKDLVATLEKLESVQDAAVNRRPANLEDAYLVMTAR